MSERQKDPIGTILLTILFILLGIMSVIYYKSIDWDVLKRLEETPIELPTPIPSETTPDSSDSAILEPTATTKQ